MIAAPAASKHSAVAASLVSSEARRRGRRAARPPRKPSCPTASSLPGTVRRMKTLHTAFRVSDLTNPAINIRYGAWYLGDLLRKYRNQRLSLAAYNAGQGNVDRWLKAGSPIQFPETRAYVSRVEHMQHVYFDAWHSTLYRS